VAQVALTECTSSTGQQASLAGTCKLSWGPCRPCIASPWCNSDTAVLCPTPPIPPMPNRILQHSVAICNAVAVLTVLAILCATSKGPAFELLGAWVEDALLEFDTDLTQPSESSLPASWSNWGDSSVYSEVQSTLADSEWQTDLVRRRLLAPTIPPVQRPSALTSVPRRASRACSLPSAFSSPMTTR
jgi:hypothetical protein